MLSCAQNKRVVLFLCKGTVLVVSLGEKKRGELLGLAFGSLSLLVCSFHCYSKGGNVCCSRQGTAASSAMRGVEKSAARPKSLTASTSRQRERTGFGDGAK